MNISIAIVCFNRNEYLTELENSIINLEGLGAASVSVFIDGPRADQELANVLNVEQFFSKSEIKNLAKNFSLKRREKNVGAWKNKIESLLECFGNGADVALLIEDDVVVSSDSLKFVEVVGTRLINSESLCTAGLYSTNLEFSGNRCFDKAQDFIVKNPEVFSAWACRSWPFPWGLIIDKNNFSRFIELGWTGNDQNMGRILLENSGNDFFPIISRARHLGVISSISGKNVETGSFPSFSDVTESKGFISFDNLSVDELKNLGDFYYRALMADDSLKFDRLCFIYRDNQAGNEELQRFKDINPCLSVFPLVYHGDNINDLTTRIYSSVYIVMLDDDIAVDQIIRGLNFAGVKFAYRLKDFDSKLLKI